MKTNGRHNGKFTPKYDTKFLPQHRGIRVDDKNNPGFWLEILFEPDDIDKLRGEYIYAVERYVLHESSDLIAICPRLATAKRIASQQKPPDEQGWEQEDMASLSKLKQPKGKELKLSISCSDITINVWKMRFSI